MSGAMKTLSRQHRRCHSAAELRAANAAMRQARTAYAVIPGPASGCPVGRANFAPNALDGFQMPIHGLAARLL